MHPPMAVAQQFEIVGLRVFVALTRAVYRHRAGLFNAETWRWGALALLAGAASGFVGQLVW